MTRLPVAHGLCLLCGKPFSIPGQALHKRFCSEEHRNRWHSLRRAEERQQKIAMEQLMEKDIEND